MSDILFRIPSLPLAQRGMPYRTLYAEFRGVRGVSDGKRQFTTDITLVR